MDLSSPLPVLIHLAKDLGLRSLRRKLDHIVHRRLEVDLRWCDNWRLADTGGGWAGDENELVRELVHIDDDPLRLSLPHAARSLCTPHAAARVPPVLAPPRPIHTARTQHTVGDVVRCPARDHHPKKAR